MTRLIDVDRATDLYAAGLPVAEIAQLLQASRTTVWRRLTAANVAIRKRGGRKPCPIDVDEVRRLYNAGLTCPEIAGRVGVSRETVRRRLVVAGVALRHGNPPRKLDIDALTRLYANGLTCAEIARRFDVSAFTIRQRLLAAGIKMRPAARRRQKMT